MTLEIDFLNFEAFLIGLSVAWAFIIAAKDL
jgi:hypothetical protein